MHLVVCGAAPNVMVCFLKSRNDTSSWLNGAQDTDLHLSVYELVLFFSSRPRYRSPSPRTTIKFASTVPHRP